MSERFLGYLARAVIVGLAASGCEQGSALRARPGGEATPIEGAAPDDGLKVCPPHEGAPGLEYGVSRQNHIDEYEGCEIIDAGFRISPFEGADLRPLRAVREVRGRLTIGDRYTGDHGFPSLEGLEGLRRVQGLTLAGIQARDLSVFRNLERIDDAERTSYEGGSSLEILQAEGLVDLQGLENVRGLYSLLVFESPALRSLQGVHLEPHPNDQGGAIIANTPVEDFADLTAQTHLGSLSLVHTPLQSLDPFRSLRSVSRLLLQDNPLLADVAVLGQFESLLRLEVTSNPLLTTLPDLPLVHDLAVVQLRSNPLLTHAPGFPGVTSLVELLVAGNPLLERLDALPALERLENGTISSNQHLLGFDFGSLLEVTGTLHVQDNPELDASALAAVQGRIKRSGNRDQTPTLMSPCPWADDEECDEPPDSELCAEGTDPVCRWDE
ncbi:MAG TPA: hypothetical protein VJU61_25625 [Polyangiaceae bacterium]|nr:hypothetical protein [Polyangiaceae bacterium]